MTAVPHTEAQRRLAEKPPFVTCNLAKEEERIVHSKRSVKVRAKRREREETKQAEGRGRRQRSGKKGDRETVRDGERGRERERGKDGGSSTRTTPLTTLFSLLGGSCPPPLASVRSLTSPSQWTTVAEVTFKESKWVGEIPPPSPSPLPVPARHGDSWLRESIKKEWTNARRLFPRTPAAVFRSFETTPTVFTKRQNKRKSFILCGKRRESNEV